MSELLQLKIQYRPESGKGASRKLRQEGMVPGIFYSYDGDNIPVKVEYLPLSRAFQEVGMSQIVELEIEQDGKKMKRQALIKDLVPHPVKNAYTHVDFFGLDMSSDVVVSVPVRLVGKAEDEVLGAVLELYREHLELRCKASNIPDAIEIDVSNLGVNENIQIVDLVLPEGTEAIYEEVFAVVGLIMPTETSEEDLAEEEEAAEEEETAEEGSE